MRLLLQTMITCLLLRSISCTTSAPMTSMGISHISTTSQSPPSPDPTTTEISTFYSTSSTLSKTGTAQTSTNQATDSSVGTPTANTVYSPTTSIAINNMSSTVSRTINSTMSSTVPNTGTSSSSTMSSTVPNTGTSSISLKTSGSTSTTKTPSDITTVTQKEHGPEGLSSSSITIITITVILLVVIILGGLCYYKIRRASYGRLLESHETLGNFTNPMYDP
ncbi:Prostate androgen-regulated mucin-like-like protein 1 [Oryzias melastigma]|uniref:Prostate androgen-regulated mucin-like-like protein 1 n=1 Tax=Oryzias melastigma TaxID=30732 RepID=A0A834CD89_ORYME|nr:prostate androgen-regulated mucin-like protein 1 homolog [Oryzias melastigma]KAF6726468.1 Prostate androgen-regulated mucin-like-like protein 1 [Oryzias melastigma]